MQTLVQAHQGASIDIGGVAHLVYARQVEGTPWMLAIAIDRAEALQPVRTLLQVTAGITVLCAVLAAALLCLATAAPAATYVRGNDGDPETLDQHKTSTVAESHILRDLYGDDAPQGFAFIAAQKTRPFDVAVHILTDDQIRLGRLLYQRDESLLLECMDSNTWPGMDRGRVIETGLSKQAAYQLYEMEPA